MAAVLSKRVVVFSDGSYTTEEVPSGGSPTQYYRVPHDIERVNFNKGDLRWRGNLPEYRNNMRGGPVRQVVIDKGEAMPEVYRLDPDHHTILDCHWQKIWRDLNPDLSDKKWSTLMGSALAWMNKTGSPPHYNCILKEPQGVTTFPRFDQARVMGGAILTGVERDGLLYIDTMRIDKKIYTASQILDRPDLWYWGTSVNPKGVVNLIPRQGMDGAMYPVRAPNLTAKQVTLPLVELHKLPLGETLPGARWIP